MQLVTMLAAVVTFPLLCLAFLLWMAHLEDTLPEAVRRTERRPDPPPILAIPVTHTVDETPATSPDELGPLALPVQRTGGLLGDPPEPAAASGAV